MENRPGLLVVAIDVVVPAKVIGALHTNLEWSGRGKACRNRQENRHRSVQFTASAKSFRPYDYCEPIFVTVAIGRSPLRCLEVLQSIEDALRYRLLDGCFNSTWTEVSFSFFNGPQRISRRRPCAVVVKESVCPSSG